jgi:hypothetical protein
MTAAAATIIMFPLKPESGAPFLPADNTALRALMNTLRPFGFRFELDLNDLDRPEVGLIFLPRTGTADFRIWRRRGARGGVAVFDALTEEEATFAEMADAIEFLRKLIARGAEPRFRHPAWW